MGSVTKAMPIQFSDSKSRIKKWRGIKLPYPVIMVAKMGQPPAVPPKVAALKRMEV